MSARPKESDVRKKQALDTGLYRKKIQSEVDDLKSDEYLARVEEHLNAKIDAAVATLAEGTAELLRVASVKDKDPFAATEEAFQMDIRVQNMIKSAQSLLGISHALKMLHLLNNEETALQVRRELAEKFQADIKADRAEAEALVDQLVAQASIT